jgi:hypothetical protein
MAEPVDSDGQGGTTQPVPQQQGQQPAPSQSADALFPDGSQFPRPSMEVVHGSIDGPDDGTLNLSQRRRGR